MAHNLLPMEDMRKTSEEKLPTVSPLYSQNEYPYGLGLCLTHEELEKLGIEKGELEVGDILHFHALAKVTSVSHNSNEQTGETSRVELQITHMSGVEDEDEENRESEEDIDKSNTKRRYF